MLFSFVVATARLMWTATASVMTWMTVLASTTSVEYVTVLALSTNVDARTFQKETVTVKATSIICGGDCEADADGDGIAMTWMTALAITTSVEYVTDLELFTSVDADIPEGDCDCNGNQLDVLGECGGDCEEDADGDGVCDDEEILGCTDTQACNFNPEATEENGLCNYDCYGCIDPMACNFDEEATMDGGGCILPGEPCDDGIEYTEDDFLQEDCSCMGYG